MDSKAWDEAERFAQWFKDNSALPPDAQKMARVLKLSEECGEAAQAVIGVLAENPRKGGITHTWDDVSKELCDTIFTGMVALATINPNAAAFFTAHVNFLRERADEREATVN